MREHLFELLVSETLSPAELSAGVRLEVGQFLTERYGASGRFTWSLWSAARACESLRCNGEPEIALQLATRSAAMARRLGDTHLVGVFHNQAGLDLNDLSRREEALEQYLLAIEAGEKTQTDDRLIHYLFTLGPVVLCSTAMKKRLNITGVSLPLSHDGRTLQLFGATRSPSVRRPRQWGVVSLPRSSWR